MPNVRAPMNDKPDPRPAKAVKLWTQHGLSKTVIAERLQCSDKSLRRWLIEAGVNNSEVRHRYDGSDAGEPGHHVLPTGLSDNAE